MSIASVSESQNNAAAASKTDLGKLSSNYTMFLSLLTTQMKNQSPLDPMDANQFTQQLVQYSSVEQLIKINTNFEDMKKSQEAGNLASLVNYVGTNVTVDGSTAPMDNGAINWVINAPKSGTASVTIKDADGKTVYEGKQALAAGNTTFAWNGRGTDGKLQPSGDYTIGVTAQTSSGAKIDTSVNVSGKVDKLEWASGTPYLVIGGKRYLTSRVVSVAT